MSEHFTTVLLVGKLVETPVITEIPPDKRLYCKVPVKVNDDEFTLVARGEVTEGLIGKSQAGDTVTVKGQLKHETWKTERRKDRGRIVIEAEKVVVHKQAITMDIET
jgi:single-stranded DNA-binding protein